MARLLSLLPPVFLIAFVNPAAAQSYPSKPVRILTSQTGGSLDFGARLIAPGLGTSLGQQVIVDNRSGNIATEVAAKAPPDGYTVLFNGAVVWITPLLRKDTSWDVSRDFLPVTLAVTSPNIIAVHPSLPARSLRELLALARARPGDINCGVGPAGTSSHLAAELFRGLAGLNIVTVPYKGAGQAMIGLLAGEVQLMFPNAASVAPYIQSGRVRALAVTSAKPSALAPGVPTAISAGLPGYEASSLNAFFAPARTPDAIVARLNQEIVRQLSQPDNREKFLAAGVEVVGSTPAQLAAEIRSEVARMDKVIKTGAIRAE
jgi:tripartite-type tricarboxylate transporter receptor subunit TctC